MERVVVLGGGESGCGAAVLATVKGFDVFLSDMGTIAPAYKTILDEHKIPYEEGGHSAELILNASLIIKSPGIPDRAPMVKAAREGGIPVISEIEFAGRYTDAKTICITGSNGKTTTTTLIYEILRDAGFNVGLAGNIGESFAMAAATKNYDWYVIELSSFQLDGMYDFRADIGVLMNITPDHLDRYDYKLQNYIDSKFRILQNQTASDTFIYCADDTLTIRNLVRHELPMQVRSFSAKTADGQAAWLADGIIRVTGTGTSASHAAPFQINMSDLKVGGIHNAYNVMAATIAALQAGVPEKSIAKTLKNFRGVEHRLEDAGEIGGVLYINDSKATNVDSAWYALESMTRPVVWIAGGTDKGNDYSSLITLAKAKVKALVCMGANNEKLLANFRGVVPRIADTHSLEDAMRAAREFAAPGDAVILSPACASFDLFKNYEDRGRQFKEWIGKHCDF